MNKRNLLTRIGSGSAIAAFVLVVAQGPAVAAPKPGSTIPTCTTNGQINCTDFFGFPNYAYSPLPAGTVTAITVITAGKGYTSVPAVTITDARGAGSGATATATVVGGIVTSITVNSPGSGYVAPQVDIAAPPATPVTNQTATATATLGGTITGGMRKFVDTLPGLTGGARPAGTALGANNLGQYIPLAKPDITRFPGSHYYEIGLLDHNEQMHSDLPVSGTKLRGYYQVNTGNDPSFPATDNTKHYLGPLILATKNVPVRVLFDNQLPLGSAGDLFIPSDTTYMGAGQGPDGTWYTQNRATLHLHGGNTPWISDGTPHQWITPPGEAGTLLKGDSFQNVPDMVGPGKPIPAPANNDGKATFYWTNQQGGRLMFYHDHAYGATRTNVYAGEAAGYLLVDPAEEIALRNATAPGTIETNPTTGALVAADLSHLIPLVIQDKTFVPDPAQLAKEDPTWTNWNALLNASIGALGKGSLWFPHVYMTNQDPNDPLNLNAFGRWDYGPWFVPPQTSLTAANPPTAVTIACSSQAYPGLTNLKCPIIPNPSGTPESFMDTPVINGTAYPVLHVAPAAYRFQILSAGNDRAFALSWFVADATGKEVPMVPAVTPTLPICTSVTAVTNPALQIGLAIGDTDATGPINGTGLPSNCWPTTWPTTTGITSAGLTGVVPNPLYAGPAWIQIGTEGGLLPAPVVIPPTPTLFETNPKSVTVGSVATHGLFLGPAERADVIVDFSRFAGKTLLLYNDAPAPVPGYDIRNDFFTGNADQAPAGGTPPTLPGYGPNTRTIMQVVVDASNANTVPFSLSALNLAFVPAGGATGLFKATQPDIFVPESTYDDTYKSSFTDTYMKIQDNSLTFTKIGAATPTTVYLKPKAIQELFTLDYGRLNATLGAELPLSNFLTQTTIPLAYIDPPNEIFGIDQSQLWRVTHNGVDTHLIHFHLFNVQVINRVGWDGTVRPADANELGWKDTVKMNPLEDIVVAIKPIKPIVPFALPDSIRKLDVTMPLHNATGFTNVDPLTNLPITVTNELTNFGWEYVWHCHILGHEENDMMRPMVFNTQGMTNIIWRDTSAGTVAAWPMDGLNSGGLQTISSAPLVWRIAGAGDFLGNNNADLLWQNTSTGEVGIWALNGLTNTGYQVIGSAPTVWTIAGVGDFNSDGKPDILWRNTSTGEIGLWPMNGLVNTGYQTLGIVPTDWQIAGVADFNGDGNADILWRQTSTGAVAIWTMNGTTHTGYFDVGVRAANFIISGVRDVDGNAYPDIIWRDTTTGAIDAWLMSGVTQTGSVNIGSAPTSWLLSTVF